MSFGFNNYVSHIIPNEKLVPEIEKILTKLDAPSTKKKLEDETKKMFYAYIGFNNEAYEAIEEVVSSIHIYDINYLYNIINYRA